MKVLLRHLFTAGVMLALSSGLSLAAGVTVRVEPPTIADRSFDPQNPPTDMPKMTPPEAALCVYSFRCNVETHVVATQTAFTSSPPKISEVNLVATLQITIWLPTNETPKMRAHEEAHRQICERSYAIAESVARELGNRTLGVRLHNKFTEQAAWKKELAGIQQDLMDTFMRRVAGPCNLAQELFDAATEHGTNAIPEDTAIERSLAAASPPSRSATPPVVSGGTNTH